MPLKKERSAAARKKAKDLKKKRAARKDGFRRKQCKLCLEKLEHLDYKDTARLSKMLTERGKIIPARISGTCASHQRMVSRAMKRARFIALLPYVAE